MKSNKKITDFIRRNVTRIVFVTVVLQPVLDVISYGLEVAGVSNFIVIIRATLFSAVLFAAFMLTKNKKIYIAIISGLLAFWVLHVCSLVLTVGYQVPFDDISMFIRVIQMPLLLLAFITFFKTERRVIDSVLLAAFCNLYFILAIILISQLTGTVHYSYGFAEIGSAGWFSNVNGQSIIVVAITLLALLYAHKKHGPISLVLTSLAGFYILFAIGTRIAFYSIPVISLIVLAAFVVTRNRNLLRYVAIIFSSLLFLSMYHVSPMYKNTVNVAARERAGQQKTYTKAEQSVGTTPKGVKPGLSSPSSSTAAIGDGSLLLQRAIYDVIVPELIDKYGFDRVYEVFGRTSDTSVLRDYRAQKRAFVILALQDSPIAVRLLGNEYGSFWSGDRVFEPENDAWNLVFLYGYVGVVVYYLIILGTLLIAAKNVLRNRHFSAELIISVGGVAMITAASLFAGHVAPRTNVSIYLSLMLALAYVTSSGLIVKAASRKTRTAHQKKVGVITIAHGTNYGNRLQNYALATVLGRYGFAVETFRQRVSYFTIAHEFVEKLRHPVRSGKALIPERRRTRAFKGFTGRHLVFSRYSVGRKTRVGRYADEYDYVVLGSDQVWNPYFRMYNRPAMFGYGLRKGQAVPYAPSFGVSAVPEDKKTEIAKYLKALSCISVREQKGIELVEGLTGRKDVVHVLDPTMLLDAKDYRVIAKRPERFPAGRKYILTYFLGQATNAVGDEICAFADKHDLDIIRLNDISDETVYAYGPSEFLYLFDHAALVLTDSFHATVFSITFRRPFVVYGREHKKEASMNSRIESLLDITGMYDQYNVSLDDENIFTMDYSGLDMRLKKERQKSLAYLERALRI